ncbi:AtpZ/AtpI family protein [Mucilaginibacter phyllosphaerae]
MAENEHDEPKQEVKTVNAYAKYTGLAVQMLVVIGIFAFAGYKIDEVTRHQTKWVTAALSLVGVFVSLYLVIRSVKN